MEVINTHRGSKFGNFANPGASDFSGPMQPLSERHRGDAGAEKDEDARAGKKSNFELRCVYCDNHVLVVHKPAGISTQPHPGSSQNLTDEAKAFIKKKYNKPGSVYLEPIHRLDKPVSGLVLFARTSKALSRLQELMRQRMIQKTYFAWVEGAPPHTEGVLEHHLVHDEHKARVVPPMHPQGKLARLTYKVIERKGEKSYLEIDLETGRYHQIRVQLSSMGCPVIGDVKYGSRISYKEGQIALHHGRLRFTHPVTKELLQFDKISTP